MLDTSFMSASYENDWKVEECVMESGCMHRCANSNYSFWNLQQNETSSYKDWKIQQLLVLSWRRGRGGRSQRNRCVDNYWGSTLVRARWAELPGDAYQQFGCQMPRLHEIQAITDSFPKQRVECRGQQHIVKLCEYCVELTCIYT